MPLMACQLAGCTEGVCSKCPDEKAKDQKTQRLSPEDIAIQDQLWGGKQMCWPQLDLSSLFPPLLLNATSALEEV